MVIWVLKHCPFLGNYFYEVGHKFHFRTNSNWLQGHFKVLLYDKNYISKFMKPFHIVLKIVIQFLSNVKPLATLSRKFFRIVKHAFKVSYSWSKVSDCSVNCHAFENCQKVMFICQFWFLDCQNIQSKCQIVLKMSKPNITLFKSNWKKVYFFIKFKHEMCQIFLPHPVYQRTFITL